MVEPYGDHALLLRMGSVPSPEVASRLRRIADAVRSSAVDCIHGYVTLAATWDPLSPDGHDVAAGLEALARTPPDPSPPPTRTVSVPVLYGGEAGPDLASWAAATRLTPRQAVAVHCSRPYRVYFLGFVPGFAYLGDLDAAVAAPRLATPRRSVPPGSVGVAGRQTGIYPRRTPGGWRLIGRTPLTVYDPARPQPALLRPGDDVVFVPTEERLPPAEPWAQGDGWGPEARPVLRVVRPGLLTLVQDLGRWGHQSEGVSPAGAADPVAARLANRAVGNPDGAAVLEITALGPVLSVLSELALAIVGADLGASLDGVPLPNGLAIRAPRRATLSFAGPRAGCRAYLAVGGGLAALPVLGSRAADPLGGLGPRPVQAGDVLRACPSAHSPAQVAGRRLRPGAYPLGALGDRLDVGVLSGPQADWFDANWHGPERPASNASDRVGLRLDGEPVARRDAWAGQELLSEPNVLGAVQVPPDGRPTVLLAGRPTVGGYPKPGVVAAVDAWRLAQVLPGAGRVRLHPVDLPWARAQLASVRALLEDRHLVAGE